MLRHGLEVELIVDITELPVKDIESLKNEI